MMLLLFLLGGSLMANCWLGAACLSFIEQIKKADCVNKAEFPPVMQTMCSLSDIAMQRPLTAEELASFDECNADLLDKITYTRQVCIVGMPAWAALSPEERAVMKDEVSN